MNRAVFLDRDGVINEDPPHYAHRIDQLSIIPGVTQAISKLKEAGYLVIVISNQSGIARGMYTHREVKKFNLAIELIINEKNGTIDKFYYCPHHPHGIIKKYSINCDCRKPKIGMIKEAVNEFSIDIKQSYLIGDKYSDIIAGINAGCTSYLVLTGHGLDERQKCKEISTFCFENLFEAVIKGIL